MEYGEVISGSDFYLSQNQLNSNYIGNVNILSGGTSGFGGTSNITQWGSVNTTLGQKTMSSSVPVVISSNQNTLAVSGTVSNNTIQLNGSTILTGNGVTGTGSQRVTIASDNTAFPIKISDGTNTATIKSANTASVSSDTSLVVAVNPNTPVLVTNVGSTSTGAFSYYRSVNLTNAVLNVKASPGNIYGYTFINTDATHTDATVAYVKFFDVAGPITVGATTPFAVLMIPANSMVQYQPCLSPWRNFQTNSINITAVSAIADVSSSPPATALYCEIVYK
jgi:hypothetical protein